MPLRTIPVKSVIAACRRGRSPFFQHRDTRGARKGAVPTLGDYVLLQLAEVAQKMKERARLHEHRIVA